MKRPITCIDGYKRLDTILFILVAFGITDRCQQPPYYMIQEVIEGLMSHDSYSSYQEITDSMRFL